MPDHRRMLDITAACIVITGSSQSHFWRAFHMALGCSPYHYLLRQRIEHAKVRLLTSDASLDEISEGCGYRSRHQFSVMFKRLVGVGPSGIEWLMHRSSGSRCRKS